MTTFQTDQTLHRRATPLQAAYWAAAADPLGERLHLAIASIYLFMLPISTAPRDIASVALLVMTILRLPKIASSYRSWFIQPIWWAMLAYMAWMTLALFWTPDVDSGLVDLKKHRMFLTPLLLWPVLANARVLIGAFLAGVAFVDILQILQWLQWPSKELVPLVSRHGAFNNAIVTGMFNALAACFWVRLLIYSPKRFPWISVAGLALCTLGLGLAASRGPIMAALLGILLAMVVPFIVQPALRARILCLVALGAVLIVPTVLAKWDVLSRQFGVIVVEYRQADEQPQTSLGMRWQMAKYGLEIFQDHPLLGVGTGGISATMPEDRDIPGIPGGSRVTLHNTYILAMATLGIPGLVLVLAVLAAGLWQAAPMAAGSLWAGGSFYGLLVWGFAAAGDAYQGSGNYLGALGFLLALSLLGSKHPAEGAIEATQGA